MTQFDPPVGGQTKKTSQKGHKKLPATWIFVHGQLESFDFSLGVFRKLVSIRLNGS